MRASQGPREEGPGGVRGCTLRSPDDRERSEATHIDMALELEELDRIVTQQLSLRVRLEPDLIDLIEALLPRQAVGPPDRAVLAHAAPDEVDRLGLEVLRHPGVNPAPDVVPLVADAQQLLDPRPSGVSAEDAERREVRGHVVEIDRAAMLARHRLQHVPRLN